ncbi:MAG: ChaN family lipoprotein [Saprospiraceae bacterium]|nr:ChaN family lipoprotein [Saprospiraceae bacterium]
MKPTCTRPQLIFFIGTFLFSMVSYAQSYRIITNKGASVDLIDLSKLVLENDVIFFGETHDDSIAHVAQLDVYQGMMSFNKEVALSLEMFETDVQGVVDEYMSGKISEDFLIKDGRAWKNYDRDYKPLVELAKQNNNKVIAANAPRRYIRMVSKSGMSSLKDLPSSSLKYLPKLPYHIQSGRYEDKFGNLMGGIHDLGNNSIYQSQNLWDATMSWSIYNFKKKNKKTPVLHLCGKFHCEENLGTVAQLKRLDKNLKIKVIVAIAEIEYDELEQEIKNQLADYIILTPGKTAENN